MSLVRFLPAWLHAIADYAVGAALIAVALVVGGSASAVATGVIVGGVVLVVSAVTRYPLGVIKILPFTVHSAGDYLASALLLVSPFVLRFNGSDQGLTALYLVAGVAVLAVSLVTNYQYGPARQLAAEGLVAPGARAADAKAATTPPRPATAHAAVPRGKRSAPARRTRPLQARGR
jgi:hypothetical protein